MGEATHIRQNTENWSYYLPILSPLVAFVSFPRLHCLGAACISAVMGENCDIINIHHSFLDINAYEEQSLSKEVPSVNDNESLMSIRKEEKERHRRKIIGQANKGRIPWNKGRKLSSAYKIQSAIFLWKIAISLTFNVFRKTLTDGRVAAQRDISKHVTYHIFGETGSRVCKERENSKEVSIADQIRAAKNRKMELAMLGLGKTRHV
ncbi:hypothetical protein D8674_022563 [Pyrus ussuriensis x Pyrus communis]|uniref:Nuclease associated modular domain-containing protein n=1 Tax=Pyrus ussuriensis x Pyrus communis TaxID=2448454 RepID=A0A5N5GK98_9ROSA|nr:hypothetical protein D8674_022563 [Pyrus ussuriensis x Pyrus communis]